MKALVGAGKIRAGVHTPAPPDVHCRRCLTLQSRETVDLRSIARHQDDFGIFDSAVCLNCTAKEAA